MGNDGWFATLFNGCSSKIRIEGQIYVPKEVMKELRFIFVSHMDDVLKNALTRPIQGLKEIKGEKESSITTPQPVQAD